MNQLFLYRSPDSQEGNGSDTATVQQTDSSKLMLTPVDYPAYVSPDGGTTNEPFPEADTEYDFCTNVFNAGDLPSAPFFIKFTISGDDGNAKEFTFQQEAGLDPQASVLAFVHYGSFPNEFIDYTLTACIYSPSAPETPINNCESFDFPVNTE